MNDDTRRLVRLQEIAFLMRDLEQNEATLPERLTALERSFQEKIEEIGAARTARTARLPRVSRAAHASRHALRHLQPDVRLAVSGPIAQTVRAADS